MDMVAVGMHVVCLETEDATPVEGIMCVRAFEGM